MEPSTILFNGSTGGLGRYFEAAAKNAGVKAIALRSRLEEIQGLETELERAFSVLKAGEAVTLLQLAAFVSVPGCEKEPERAYQTNVTDTVETVKTFIHVSRRKKLTPRIIYTSTGHVYAPKAGKIREDDPVAPRSVYAKTKLEAESKLSALCQTENTPILTVRVFGLVAPNQPPYYVLPSLFRRATDKNLRGVPGLSNTRDYLDSRDVCSALAELSLRPFSTPVLNLCAGEAASIRSILEACLDGVRPSEAATLKNEITEAPGRPDDIAMIVGDPCKIEAVLDRNPKTISIQETIRDIPREV